MPAIAINECPSERSAPSNGEAQEIVQPNDENLKRASAGGIGGLSGNELFLVVLAICVTAFCVVNLIFNYQHMGVISTIAALVVAILAIVAVIIKSSILMLIVLIVLSIVKSYAKFRALRQRRKIREAVAGNVARYRGDRGIEGITDCIPQDVKRTLKSCRGDRKTSLTIAPKTPSADASNEGKDVLRLFRTLCGEFRMGTKHKED
nr:unnamed protein product [Haemonchus contortus]